MSSRSKLCSIDDRRSRPNDRDISFSIVVRLIAPRRTVTSLAYVCTRTSGRFARCFLVVPAGRLNIERFQGRFASCAIRAAARYISSENWAATRDTLEKLCDLSAHPSSSAWWYYRGIYIDKKWAVAHITVQR